MNIVVQQKIAENAKMAELLKQNSYWFKYLNRDEKYLKDYLNEMKDKYRLRFADKVSDAIDNIDLISNILENLK